METVLWFVCSSCSRPSLRSSLPARFPVPFLQESSGELLGGRALCVRCVQGRKERSREVALREEREMG